MRIAVAALIALAVSPAAAETATSTEGTCEVRFVRAPGEVRHVIEAWLAAEPRCSSSIDLRVVPTADGFYLLAQRPDGRIHERLVPDAQSAGVLVASWVADDWVAPPPPPAREPALAPPLYTTPTGSPGVSAVSDPQPRPDRAPRWLSVGVLLAGDDNGGLRAEVDVFSRGSFTLGAALGWTQTWIGRNTEGDAELWSSDVAATGFTAYTLRGGRWELRGALGIGAAYSRVQGINDTAPGEPSAMPYSEGRGLYLVGTASLILSMRISERWGVHAGALGHSISQQIPTASELRLDRDDERLFFFTGLRRQI